MTNVLLQGRELFQSVTSCGASAAFWWLGQHSFIVKLDQFILLIDPFLDPVPGRLVPPLFRCEDASGIVDLVCCTHEHGDHIDPKAIPGLAQHTTAQFVAPRAHAGLMQSLGVPATRLITLNEGETASVGSLAIHAIKSKHEFFHETPNGLFPHLGYVIEGAGKTIYHAGDTLWWEGLQARLSRWSFDVAMVPINGRDARRYAANCIGNMTYQEAADLTGELAVRLTVPTHYDMFTSNSENPNLFIAYMKAKYPSHHVWVGQPTECVPF
jgi:L-ascorbate metabolism protein UlaG (beta-lactamase superfamily)